MMFKQIHFVALLCAIAIVCSCTSSNQQKTDNSPPYKIVLEELVNQQLPDLHSFTQAVYNDKIVLIGGRTNGLHGGSYAFNQAHSNTNIYVIDTKNWSNDSVWKVYTMPDSDIILDAPTNTTSRFFNKGQFRANNEEFFTKDSTLYIIGGLLGKDSLNNPNGPNTLPYFTAINLPALINTVIAKTVLPQGAIRQVQDPVFAITGGELRTLGNTVYLVFGWNFNFTNDGYYTHKVQSFTYTDNKATGKLQATFNKPCATCWDGMPDSSATGNFRRRDGSISDFIDPSNETEALIYYAGVFKNGNTNFDSPVWINETSALDQPFKMRSNVYTCQVIPFYSPTKNESYATLMGGMTNTNYIGGAIKQPTLLTDKNAPFITPDTINFLSVPFSNQFSTIVVNKAKTFSQYLLPDSFPAIKTNLKLPTKNSSNSLIDLSKATTFNGAEAEIIYTINPKLMYKNVINYDALINDNASNGKIGYLYGGILSVMQNLNMNNKTNNQEKYSCASNRIFVIRVVPIN